MLGVAALLLDSSASLVAVDVDPAAIAATRRTAELNAVDERLIEVSRRLRAAMRTSDIVARLGGDEFVLLLPHIAEVSDGEQVANKLLKLFAEPIRIGPHELRVTPSIGLALYPAHGTDAITLMRHADLAMYQAKNKGRNRVQVYSDQMNSTTADTLVLENYLIEVLLPNVNAA